ncbi:MAG TPA: hypothetical protein VE890_01870, partial [Thermoguttaceae bacterium]|nr:hypothetical protein [Thermoguttaceae bacterium]
SKIHCYQTSKEERDTSQCAHNHRSAVGGALISVAGLFVTDVWTFFLSGGGAFLVIFGCILFAVMHFRGWPEDS